MKLVEKANEIFAKVEPQLVYIARKYKVHDPIGEARSWYFRFHEILSGFDSGKYEKKFVNKDGDTIILLDNADTATQEEFLTSLVAYLKKAYKNELYANHNKQSRIQLIAEYDDNLVTDKIEHISDHESEDIITLEELIGVIAGDVRRAERNASVARDDTNHLFLMAVYKFYQIMLANIGNFPIVRDYYAEQAKDFFIYDIREGRTEGISREFAMLVEQSKSRTIALVSKKLLAKDTGYFALNRKISRYFNEYQSGMPLRLKELKEKRRARPPSTNS